MSDLVHLLELKILTACVVGHNAGCFSTVPALTSTVNSGGNPLERLTQLGSIVRKQPWTHIVWTRSFPRA